ncbi:bifunctional diaminohydroxyphosphoribosylaminopyrimidine deaminase/5-amino-6-(5-phosphoribosylamino)uracil reductase RibD [Paenibacillus sp. J5C_2022]|uniref:bifunctional diaminohydroxyphosphoribosylaminopyrimidine deaminase/5-amino-6-(5-phosphoribosylamino)uracil reductase RibD n=1 Tax=Paenibacillus sp. J5C2022 TaxID=2977129 RepID=UPI0021D12643|nr:bifunctional diaminohydroxyphosphoribosylaminopyrimidine deaminase/5-amino-6-(5-phosphoribosylamino)uracil reductase RibD [Paenibacillus sp. J5C2022]MCU6710064.1 bifunctional diaminohydroxyphosphoribosylaminopyrimidine deaminase/5-amino-6-(5-phosphoribosylamino)uracil reductase RibD [Paenibacillus sp. J5C2022]
MKVLNDKYYMQLALELAACAEGQTGINPVVGCVIVKDGSIVGMGAHLKRGEGHAEVHALAMAGEKARGATAYVTLEPCSHHGKTPPCANRLIEAGVAKVVVAATDPNPQVSGRGLQRLFDNGIVVVSGVLQEQAERLNEKFNKYITTGMPYVTLKTASTLDGKIAARTGDSKWVTGPVAREQVHTLRHQHQGIMVGIETVIADDPSLTTRTAAPGLQPVRIVADSKLRVPLTAKVVSDRTARTVILTTDNGNAAKRAQLEEAEVEVLACGSGPHIDLTVALKQLGRLEIGSILLEGGGTLNGAMLQDGLIDKVILYYAAKIVGGPIGAFTFPGMDRMSDAVRLRDVEVEMAGEDIRVIGYPVYPSR